VACSKYGCSDAIYGDLVLKEVIVFSGDLLWCFDVMLGINMIHGCIFCFARIESVGTNLLG
jgi:hypothetical protein